MGQPSLGTRILGLALLAALLPASGCASLGSVDAPRYGYFQTPDRRDPWSPKIAGWQSRERAVPADARAPASVSGSRGRSPAVADGGEDLRTAYAEFRIERKRALARDVASWIQREARSHYIPDGAIDHWATLEETLSHNGDDCDGLELLVYHFLRDLGFGAHEVYRAIVYRPDDGQHHMVTLWFEDRNDPWVIDPTGAMVTGMPHMSEVPGWVPLKVFSEDEEFSVRGVSAAPASPAPR